MYLDTKRHSWCCNYAQ